MSDTLTREAFTACPAAAPSAAPRADAAHVSVHGVDAQTGFPVTWHVTTLAEDGLPGAYLIERAEGDIRNPAVWMQARRTARTVGELEVLDLIREVLFQGGSLG